MKKDKNQKGVSGLVMLIAIAAVISIGATGYILMKPSGISSIPFLSNRQESASPTSGFGSIVVPTDKPLSSSDKVVDIESELASTTLGEFDTDLSELDNLISEL